MDFKDLMMRIPIDDEMGIERLGGRPLSTEELAELEAMQEKAKRGDFALRVLGILRLLVSEEPYHDPCHPEWRPYVRSLIQSAESMAKVLIDSDGVRKFHDQAIARTELAKEKEVGDGL